MRVIHIWWGYLVSSTGTICELPRTYRISKSEPISQCGWSWYLWIWIQLLLQSSYTFFTLGAPRLYSIPSSEGKQGGTMVSMRLLSPLSSRVTRIRRKCFANCKLVPFAKWALSHVMNSQVLQILFVERASEAWVQKLRCHHTLTTEMLSYLLEFEVLKYL